MAAAFLPFASLLVSALLVADPAMVRTQQTADRATVTLEWLSPVTYTTTVDGREILVQFGRPLAFSQPPELAGALPAWIEAATSGFDTLLIRAARDTTFSVSAAGATVVIEMTGARRTTEQALPSPDDTQAELRLNLLRAQLLVAEGRWTRADRILARAAEGGRQREAADLRSQVRADQGGRTRIDIDVKDVQHAQTELVTRLSTHGFIGGYVRVGGVVENNQATLADHVHSRQRAEAYVQKDFDSGSELRVSAFGTRSGFGGGMHYGESDPTGRTQVHVEYRRPFWEFVEGLLGNGTRDRVEIHREQQLGSRVSGRMTAAFNRYGLQGAMDIAQSTAFDGGLNVAPRRSNPIVAFEYGIDVESPRFLVAGTIPLVSREVHAGSGIVQLRFSPRLFADASAGYVWDRLGGRGPFTAARLRHGGPGRLGFELSYDRRLNTVATGQVVTRVGAFLHWRFD